VNDGEERDIELEDLVDDVTPTKFDNMEKFKYETDKKDKGNKFVIHTKYGDSQINLK